MVKFNSFNKFNEHLLCAKHCAERWRNTDPDQQKGRVITWQDLYLVSPALQHKNAAVHRDKVNEEQRVCSDSQSMLVAASINLIKLPNWLTTRSPCQTCKSVMEDEMIGIFLPYTYPGAINYNSLEWHLCLGIWRQLKELCMYCCN